MVLASGMTDIAGTETADDMHPQTVGFDPSDLSEAFYANNRTTVAHIDETWGDPLNVKDMSDGTRVRV